MAKGAPARIREERRLVTCMFVDVVGSTEMTMTLGAERLKHDLGAAFKELSGIITAHGGTVEKYVGDAIYAIFGAPVAHEDDALRALRAAEALRAWAVTGAFKVRVGVETGEAVVDLEAAADTRQQMSVGPVVNIAARLQQRAEPGDVLVGPTARQATAGVAELEPMADAELKGLGRVPVWRLVRVGAPALQQLPFVGREAELGLLGLAYDRARKGRSVLAVVSGPPGQGKTRLVQEFLSARANGAQVIPTRCRPAAEVGVFAPVRQILGVTTLDALSELVSRVCTDDVECERVVAGLAESTGIATSSSLTHLPAAEREDEIVQAWRRYLAAIGSERLVILAIDDIHWADPSLVRLVDRLSFGGPRLLVVATARPEFAEAAGVRPSGDRFFIELEGLDLADARALAAHAGRDDDRVVERAEGNPLFLVELARASSAGELPLTLQGALGARLDELSPEDRTLLAAASVAGERFTAEEAAFLAERDLVDVGRALARLVDLHFLDLSADGYRFHHGLVRDVAYGRLLTAERMKAHARFARGRVGRDDLASLAYHWWEALGPADAEWVWSGSPDLDSMREQAFAAQLAAARDQTRHFATQSAIALLERALTFASGDAAVARVEHELGVAHHRVLRQDEAWTHYMRALDGYRRSGDVPLALYSGVLQAAANIGAFREQPADEEVRRIGEEATDAARAAGDDRSLSFIQRSLGSYSVNRFTSKPRMARPYVEEAVAAAERSGDRDAISLALLAQASLLRVEGRVDESLPLFERIAPLIVGADALDRMNVLRFRGLAELQMGDLDGAERTVTEAVNLAEPMGPHIRTHAWVILSHILYARGAWSRLIELSQRTARLVRDEKASAFCGSAVEVLQHGAVAHALGGQREEALALIKAMPRTDIVEVEIIVGLPRALLGLVSPGTDDRLRSGRPTWPDWADAATRAVILRRPDEAEAALAAMGPVTSRSVAYRAFAESVREAVAELRGGPPATHAALRKIGFDGWAEVLSRRVDAGY